MVYSQIILDRLVFVLCELCSLGDVCVIIILHFINVNSVSLGIWTAQNFGRGLQERNLGIGCVAIATSS